MDAPRHRAAWISLLASIAVLSACADPSGGWPTAPSERPAFARAPSGGGPAVTAVNPASARQGTALDVQITGVPESLLHHGGGFDEIAAQAMDVDNFQDDRRQPPLVALLGKSRQGAE